MAEPWIEAIGLFAGLLGIVAWIPQIREVWSHGRHEGISVTSFSVVSLALMLWLLYGVLVNSLAMIVANIATLGVLFLILGGVLRLRRAETRAANQRSD